LKFGILLLFLGKLIDLCFIVLLEVFKLLGTEIKKIELAFGLKFFCNKIETVFLGAACIIDFTGYFASTQKFIAGFYLVKLLLLCFCFRAVDAFITNEINILSFAFF